MQQGRHAARNMLAMIQGRKPQASVVGQGNDGDDRANGRCGLKFVHLSGLPAWLAVVCAHHFWSAQSVAGAFSMGVGVFNFQQRRTINHATSIGQRPRCEAQCHVENETSLTY
jgi:hypothetical protein